MEDRDHEHEGSFCKPVSGIALRVLPNETLAHLPHLVLVRVARDAEELAQREVLLVDDCRQRSATLTRVS